MNALARRECPRCARVLSHGAYRRDPDGPDGLTECCRRCLAREPQEPQEAPEPQEEPEPNGALPHDVPAGWERVVRVRVVEGRLVLQAGRPVKTAGGGTALLSDGRGLSVPAEHASAIARAIQRAAATA
jgi:hypothetical protein